MTDPFILALHLSLLTELSSLLAASCPSKEQMDTQDTLHKVLSLMWSWQRNPTSLQIWDR